MQDVQHLVSATWLLEHLHDTDIRIFDATYHMPATGRIAAEEFSTRHIPGAHFFDIDAVADPHAVPPHMLPTPHAFAQAVEAMGMRDGMTAVAYDTHGLMSAARLWWMFRVFGYDHVAVLDGGLPAWIAAGGELETGTSQNPPSAGSFTARFRPELVRNRDQVLAAVHNHSAMIIDARGGARFRGEAAEPRAGVRQGHIPGSSSVPYTELLDQNGLLKDPTTLRERFKAAGIISNSPVIASCGSGVTACVLALGLAQLGRTDVAVYDGSWSEWGADATCPIELGL